MKAVCSSYFCNYVHSFRSNQHEKRKKKKKIKERKKRKITEKANTIRLSNTISKRESIAIKFQEGCKVSDCVTFWVPIIVIFPIFVENVMMSFDWV